MLGVTYDMEICGKVGRVSTHVAEFQLSPEFIIGIVVNYINAITLFHWL